MVRGHIFVPMDDANCMVYNWTYTFGDSGLTPEEQKELDHHIGSGSEERTNDYRKTRNKENNWLIDRQVQKTETYTGIEGINTQDHAIQESMGPVVDRTEEHLGSTRQSDRCSALAITSSGEERWEENRPSGNRSQLL